MSGVGRKPKPTALRIIQGNPGKRPMPEKEPKPEAKAPRTPTHLTLEQKKVFRQLSKQLDAARIITKLDSTALEMLCEAYLRWRNALDGVNKKGLVVKSKDGVPFQNPYLGVANRAFDQMQKMLTEFGMTPSSRTRVQTVGEDKKVAGQYDEYT